MNTWGVIDGLLSDLGAGTSWEAPGQYADRLKKGDLVVNDVAIVTMHQACVEDYRRQEEEARR